VWSNLERRPIPLRIQGKSWSRELPWTSRCPENNDVRIVRFWAR
jgi:hypothetical protein